MPTPKLLTVKQISELLGLAQVTVRLWIAQRRLNAVKLGHRAIRVPESEVSRLIAEGALPRSR